MTRAPDDPAGASVGDGESGDIARLDSLHAVDASKAMANATSADRHVVIVMSLLRGVFGRAWRPDAIGRSSKLTLPDRVSRTGSCVAAISHNAA
jgi:hypothetical protein